MAASRSSSVDVRALVGLIEDGREDLRGSSLPWPTLGGLLRVVGAEVVAVVDVDARTSMPLLTQSLSADGGEEGELDSVDPEHPFVRYFAQWGTAIYPRTTGDTLTPVRWSDFYSLRQLPNHPLWADYFRDCGYIRGLSMSLPVAYPRERRVILWRGKGSDFDDQDVHVMTLLRPHLHALHWELEQHRVPRPSLTPRQHEVLRLAARGLSNSEIAAALVISVGTVRKHLENAYARTGTHSRAAAALAVPAAPLITGSGRRRNSRFLPRST